MLFSERTLATAREDVRRLLEVSRAPDVLLSAMREGRIDGNEYLRRGDDGQVYGCAIGHLGTVVSTYDLRRALDRPGFRGFGMIEHMLINVQPGDTPTTSEPLERVEQWIKEWQAEAHDVQVKSAIERVLEESKQVLATVALLAITAVTALVWWR